MFQAKLTNWTQMVFQDLVQDKHIRLYNSMKLIIIYLEMSSRLENLLRMLESNYHIYYIIISLKLTIFKLTNIGFK